MRHHLYIASLVATLAIAPTSRAARLGDISEFQAERENKLFGVGLVIGLAGTGDSSSSGLTQQMLQSMVDKAEVVVDTRAIKSKNVAVVALTAELPANAEDGVEFDVTVSSMMDASSLRGGELVATSLVAANDRVYALAQGTVIVGGVSASSRGSSVQVGHVAAGVVPNGGRVVQAASVDLNKFQFFTITMHRNEVVTATNAVRAINHYLYGDFAHAINGRTVVVQVPDPDLGRVPELYAALKPIPIDVYREAKVVVDQRTGTVIVGEEVRVAKVAIAKGGLMVRVDTQVGASQPNAFSPRGRTERLEQSDIEVREDYRPMGLVEGISLSELVSALNEMGVSPEDMVAIFKDMKAAGALDAELEIL